MVTRIQSKTAVVNAPVREVFDYLCDFRHFKELLPQNKIADWTATYDNCSFKVQNAITIPLVKSTVTPHSTIGIVSGEKAPFPFNLTLHLQENEQKTSGHFDFEGTINAFLKPMVTSPLKHLFNGMVEQLQQKFNQ